MLTLQACSFNTLNERESSSIISSSKNNSSNDTNTTTKNNKTTVTAPASATPATARHLRFVRDLIRFHSDAYISRTLASRSATLDDEPLQYCTVIWGDNIFGIRLGSLLLSLKGYANSIRNASPFGLPYAYKLEALLTMSPTSHPPPVRHKNLGAMTIRPNGQGGP